MSRERRWSGVWLAVVAIAVAEPAAQAQGTSPLGSHVATSQPHRESAPGRALREIRDPHTGQQWILLADPANPAGPGRLVVATQTEKAGAFSAIADVRQPAIHPGDKVVVEEHSAVVDAFLDGVALGQASIGSRLKVRLRIGNRVVGAIAVAPGRAALRP